MLSLIDSVADEATESTSAAILAISARLSSLEEMLAWLSWYLFNASFVFCLCSSSMETSTRFGRWASRFSNLSKILSCTALKDTEASMSLLFSSSSELLRTTSLSSMSRTFSWTLAPPFSSACT